MFYFKTFPSRLRPSSCVLWVLCSEPRASHQSPAGSPEPATWGLQAWDDRSHICLHSLGLPSPSSGCWGRTLCTFLGDLLETIQKCDTQLYRNQTQFPREKQHGRKRLKSLLSLQKATDRFHNLWTLPVIAQCLIQSRPTAYTCWISIWLIHPSLTL